MEDIDRAERLISAAENQIKANRLLNKAIESEIDALLDHAEELEQAALSKLKPLPNYEKLARDVDPWPAIARKELNKARKKILPLRDQQPTRSEIQEAWERYRKLRERLKTVLDMREGK
ncbi:hypothetical protein [Corynebacterium cystitidis]|uniref:hypothetical protein n=1 Tax=Corynebacterium cystitidis TaxID=35757 RepID=UPI00211F0BE9|nr:hypothetical protein [Corynebacterium cystitidis]